MHAVVVTVEIDTGRPEEAVELLHGFTVPRVRQAPGFVRGTWGRSLDGATGHSLLLFESEAAALAVHRMVTEAGPPPGAPVALRSATVVEVLAEA